MVEAISGYGVGGCWVFFFVYWIISARRVKTTAEKQNPWASLIHRIPLGLSYYLLLAWFLPPPMSLSVTSHADWVLAAGSLICVLGLCVTLWARRTLAGNWSSDVAFKQGHELIRRGPYRFVRHPIYTGLLTMCLGTAVNIGAFRGWLALPLMAAALVIKLKKEEALLLQHFPDEYPAYRKQVKALVPFVI
jgi:protein-S-isoprenylcysteine O-methyltransferase Ste14